MKLSAIIIAKNAEDQIADTLSSVDFADEVIVVDNGSTDRTVEIAKYFKAKVFVNNVFDFSKLRNFALRQAQGQWVLYIDTDERITTELRKEIEGRIMNQKSGISAYRIKRKNFYFGSNEWPYIEKLVRLFRKDKLLGWRGRVHESPVIDTLPAGRQGRVGELDGFLLHYTHRGLSSMVRKTIEWSKIEAELRLKAHHPKVTWWRFLRVMATSFFDSYIRQGGWRVGTVGLIESIYQAFSIFITYARLWEKQQKLKTF